MRQDDATRVKALRDSAVKTLRQTHFPRTNQFDVQHELQGLEEKFRVHDEERLADALRIRLDELGDLSEKWRPEILHLLLLLSDNPLQKSDVDDIAFLKRPESHEEPTYRWEDLVAEDPLFRDDDIWRNIDYGAESPEEDTALSESDDGTSAGTEATNVTSEHDGFVVDSYVIPIDGDAIKGLEAAQFWRKDNASLAEGLKTVWITELQTIREVLFALSGLPTTLFEVKLDRMGSFGDIAQDYGMATPSKAKIMLPKSQLALPIVSPAPHFVLRHASPQVFHQILATFADYATRIGVVRAWSMTKQTIALLQGLQDQLSKRLQALDRKFGELQRRYVVPIGEVVVSLAQLQAEVDVLVQPYLRLARLMKSLLSDPYSHAFRCLELLYEETCVSQMAGDDELYQFMGTLFFDCFQIYIRPIRTWMETGEVSATDHVFFITQTLEKVELASLWQKRYKLRKTSRGTLHAPNFLVASANKIFTSGKSIVVLKHLGRYDKLRHSSMQYEPTLNFATVCESSTGYIAPFPELFGGAFDRWIQSKYYATSSILRLTLLDDCGLSMALDALECIYFMADGAAATTFTNSLFEKVDSGKKSWNDQFTLTELARETIGSLSSVTAEALRVSMPKSAEQSDLQEPKSVQMLGALHITYSLPWPVQIIVAKETMLSYHRIFGFLLDIRRSIYLLHSGRQSFGSMDENALFYKLHNRLLWFNTTLYSYLTDLVIGINTAEMRKELDTAEDTDQMIKAHQMWLKKIIDQALLGSKVEPIHKTIISLLDLAAQLSNARLAHIAAREAEKSRAEQLGLSPRKKRSNKPQRPKQDDSEDEDWDHGTEGSRPQTPAARPQYEDDLRDLLNRFDRLVRFTVSGLRGIARAGSEPMWDMLADKFDSGMGNKI